ncbi:MAG: alkaline phosphatase family protein [Nitrospirales bacterium]|nr:alkaline phosphatase family protein [Nitrospirales bacterium]
MIAIVQFDAVNLPHLHKLLEENRLPTLKRLQASGQWFPLETDAVPWEGATYYSLYSGKGMTDHGLYFPFMWSAADQRVRPQTDFPAPDFIWDRIGRAKRRSLVIDPYDTCRHPRTLEGTAISGWQFKHKVTMPQWSVPKGLNKELQRKFGRSPLVEEVYGCPSGPDLMSMRRHLLEAPRRCADAAVFLLERESFDLAWITLSSSHLAGHWFLNPIQLPQDEFDRSIKDDIKTALTDAYIAVDQAIGRILEALPPDTVLLVLSPSGMGKNSSRSHLLPGMLEAVLSEKPFEEARSTRRGGNSLWRIRAAIPRGLRAWVARALPDRLTLELTARLDMRGVDWSTTPAFMVPSGDCGYIRLNLKDREREGIVSQTEVPALLQRITSGLMSFRDPDGAPTITNVELSTENLHLHSLTHPFPDLIVHWNERLPTHLTGVQSPDFGPVPSPGWGSGRTGEHCDGAWVLIQPGSTTLKPLTRSPHIVDIAATVCECLGVDLQGLAGDSLLAPNSGKPFMRES